MAKTILVVDDNDLNRTLLIDVLTLEGYTVLTAKDGSEGVAMALAHTPDLILMDIQMPVMNGIEAAKALRSAPQTRNIALLALSSYNSLGEKDDFFQTGFDAHLEKPLNLKKAKEIIARYCAGGANHE